VRTDAATGAPPERWVLDVISATDPTLCGGKATGLAKLERAGWAIPPAVCLTTAFYRRWGEASGLATAIGRVAALTAADGADARREALAGLRRQIETASIPEDLEEVLRDAIAPLTAASRAALSVRSSAVHEDDGDASHAGIHASVVVAEPELPAIIAALRRCWASSWTEAAWTYRERLGLRHHEAAMAVVVQRFVSATCSGVAFSVDPLTNDPAAVVIEAAWGAGAALVGGIVTPDQYRVTIAGGAPGAVHRRAGHQRTLTTRRDGTNVTVPLPSAPGQQFVLSEPQARAIARGVKSVEQAFGVPVDVEWIFDGRQFWAVQARPITTLPASPGRPQTVWTRANLKEVFPELPSPLAVSYLKVSLNLMFKAYHQGQGYTVPPDAELVSSFHGRPYLNLSLMGQMATERGGDPAIITRLFGGTSAAEPRPAPVMSPRAGGLPSWARIAREMLATFFLTPGRGRRLFRRLRRNTARYGAVRLSALDDTDVVAHFLRFTGASLDDKTVRCLHEVVSAQSRAYMVLEHLLVAWIASDATHAAETLAMRLMTGLGTLPNVRMTYRLMELAALAMRDPRAGAFFTEDLDEAAVRGASAALAGSEFGDVFRAFMAEFGHRGYYESDVMSLRFIEDPGRVLRLIQLHIRGGGETDPVRHAAERRRARAVATADVRRLLRTGTSRLGFAARWAAFSGVCHALQRLLAMRDECRHVTTLLLAHLRRVTLEIGGRASRQGLLGSVDDVFFLEWDELPRVLIDKGAGWRDVVVRRRGEYARNAERDVPDLMRGDGSAAGDVGDAQPDGGDELWGYGVSPGTVTGRVRVLRSADDIGHLSAEVIAVFPAIEPTLAPIFPLVRGLVAEMGGLLSHAAILAREYGLPAVVSVRDATRRLRDGDHVELDGATGRIRVLERSR
jgi:phosphohistidine swiveling domain-containing protein